MWLLIGCVGTVVPHGGPEPSFPLVGAHARAPCAACHGAGTPHALPGACAACHADDVPAPDHNPGQDCGVCHDPEGWAGGAAPPQATSPAPPTVPAPTTTVFEHVYTPPDQPCADCHEADRLSSSHFTSPEPWDCGPCHAQSAWSDGPIVHPARTPHGSGVVACADCHPAKPPAAVCSDCHADIFPHYGGATEPGPAADATCLGCHPAAM